MFGVMIDCSRNAVMNVPTVKRFAILLQKWVITPLCFIPRIPMRLIINPISATLEADIPRKKSSR